MLVRVLLCTLYTTCFGLDQWPSSCDLQHKIYLEAVTNISTDPIIKVLVFLFFPYLLDAPFLLNRCADTSRTPVSV
jgi:hypothetical protein